MGAQRAISESKTMMYFVSTGSTLLGEREDIGVITSPRSGISQGVREGRVWVSDCDVFSKHGYQHEDYLAHLERMRPWAKKCQFVVVPDLPGDGEGTYEVYWHHARELAEFGYPLAYVFQDGSEYLPIPPCDYTFIGGTDDWRQQHAAAMIQRAHDEGLGCHVGRVNSEKRMRMLAYTPADSADGTHLAFVGPKNGLADVSGWLTAANGPRLFTREAIRERYQAIEDTGDHEVRHEPPPPRRAPRKPKPLSAHVTGQSGLFDHLTDEVALDQAAD